MGLFALLLRFFLCVLPLGLLNDFFPSVCKDPLPPVTTEQFLNDTFTPGGMTEEITEDDPIVVGGSGNEEGPMMFEVTGNFTTAKDGIVSLADAQPPGLIAAVECSSSLDDDSTTNADEEEILMARIRFGADVPPEVDVPSLFPIGAVLFVKASVFGPCDRVPLPDDDDGGGPINVQAFREVASSGGDGYIIIESVSLERQGGDADAVVVVTGQRGFFYSLFEDSQLFAKAVLTSEGGGNERRLAHECITDSFSHSEDLIPHKLIMGVATGTVTIRSCIKDISLDLDLLRGFVLKVQLLNDYELEGNLNFFFEIGSQDGFPIKKFDPLISVPIGPPFLQIAYALHRVLKRIKKGDKDAENLPEIKVGFYFELVPQLKVTRAVYTQKFGPSANFVYGYRQTLNATASFNPITRIPILTAEEIEGDTTTEPKMTIDFEPVQPGTFEFNFYVGLRGQVYLYFTELVRMGRIQDIGVEV